MDIRSSHNSSNRTSMPVPIMAIAVCLVALHPASAQQSATTPSQTFNTGQTNPLSADDLYRGWRASGLIVQPVLSKSQQKL